MTYAGGLWMVHVMCEREPCRLRRLQESFGNRQQLILVVPSHRDGTVGPMKVVTMEIEVVLHLAKEWEQLHEGPLIVAFRRPVVVVFRNPPEEHLSIDSA